MEFLHSHEEVLTRLAGVGEFHYANEGGKIYKEGGEVHMCPCRMFMAPGCLWLGLELSVAA